MVVQRLLSRVRSDLSACSNACGIVRACTKLPRGSCEIHHSTSGGRRDRPGHAHCHRPSRQNVGSANHAGQSTGRRGAIAARAAASAAPDGYTLYMAIASTFISLPELQPNLAPSINDFVPIGFVGEVPMAIAVSPALPVNSLPELIAYSRTQQGGLNVAIPNRGGIPHLATELFRERSGAELTYVFYPGSAQAMSDVISGRVPMIIEGLAGPLAGGQVKLLAVASPARLATRPNLPTVSETVPGFAASGWFVLVAPPGTPSSIVRKVSGDLRDVLARADVKQKFDELSLSTRPMSSEELGDFIRSEQQLWKPVIKQIGVAMQ